MSEYSLSKLADADVVEILISGIDLFGREQAVAYIEQLEVQFDRLAQNPHLGRKLDRRPRLFRSKYGAHIIFYKLVSNGIFVVRVLHERMDSDRHL